jgi:hypothetical protein
MADAVEILFKVGNFREIEQTIGGLESALDRLAKNGQAAGDRAAKATAKSAGDASKAVARGATEAKRVQEREAREVVRVREAINRLEVRDWAAKEREKTRASEQEERTRTRAVERAMAERERSVRRFGNQVGSATTRAMGTAGRIAGTALALGGGFSIADSLGAGVRQEAQAGAIVRSAQITGGLGNKDVQSAAHAAAIGVGATKEDELGGISAFVKKTGDLKTGVDLLRDMARYAAASDTAMADMGSTAAEVFNAVGNVDQTKTVLLALAGQAKAGAIDFPALAQYGARLTSTAGLFEGGVGQNIENFGALAQLAKAKGGASDAAEATESVATLFSEIAMHADAFKDLLGHDVKGKSGLMLPVQDLLLETLVKNKGDITAIPKMFGRQAGKVELGLSKAFLEASGGKTDAASLERGRAAASSLISSYKAPMSEQEVEAAVQAKLAENQSRLNIAMENLHESLNGKLLPKLPELIDALSRMIPAVTKLADTFANFPIESIIALLGGKIVAEVAAAQIGGRVATALVDAIKGRAGTGEPSALPSSPGASGINLLGRALPAAALVAEASQKMNSMIGGGYDASLQGDLQKGGALADLVASGKASPEERAEAEQRLRAAQSLVVGARDRKEEGSSLFGTIGGDAAATAKDLFGKGGAQQQREQEAAAARNFEQLNAIVERLTKSLGNVDEVAQAIGHGDDPSNPSHPSRGGVQ